MISQRRSDGDSSSCLSIGVIHIYLSSFHIVHFLLQSNAWLLLYFLLLLISLPSPTWYVCMSLYIKSLTDESQGNQQSQPSKGDGRDDAKKVCFGASIGAVGGLI